MSKAFFRIFKVFALILLIQLPLSSCAKQLDESVENAQSYTINPSLREYYQDLGGDTVLGGPISDLINWKGAQCQYTVSALLCIDREKSGDDRFFLAPIGQEIINHFTEQILADIQISDALAEEMIYPPFKQVQKPYREEQDIGNPLTLTVYNLTIERTEQYFERLGFFQRFYDAPNDIALLPYGALHCGIQCDQKYLFEQNNLQNFYLLTAPFASKLDEMGGMAVYGKPLTSTILKEDDLLEQVFENIVVYQESDSQVSFRPTASLLKMISHPPGAKTLGSEQNVIFYSTQDELGYHVPLVFDDFISNHGGMAISGNPIAETMIYEGETNPRQCFENYCLEYDHTTPDDSNIRLTPLGIRYLDELVTRSEQNDEYTSEAIELTTGEEKSQVPPWELQTISINVIEKESQEPLENIESKVTLFMEDGTEKVFYPPLTDKEGISRLTLPSFQTFSDGTIISYKACLYFPYEKPLCQLDSFMIWGEP